MLKHRPVGRGDRVLEVNRDRSTAKETIINTVRCRQYHVRVTAPVHPHSKAERYGLAGETAAIEASSTVGLPIRH